MRRRTFGLCFWARVPKNSPWPHVPWKMGRFFFLSSSPTFTSAQLLARHPPTDRLSTRLTRHGQHPPSTRRRRRAQIACEDLQGNRKTELPSPLGVSRPLNCWSSDRTPSCVRGTPKTPLAIHIQAASGCSSVSSGSKFTPRTCDCTHRASNFLACLLVAPLSSPPKAGAQHTLERGGR